MNYFVNFPNHLVFLLLKLGVLEVFSMIATQTMKKKNFPYLVNTELWFLLLFLVF